MSAVLAYAVALLLNLGVMSTEQAQNASSTVKVIVRDGKTIVVDTISDTEILIY